jgi:hypothetical protein
MEIERATSSNMPDGKRTLSLFTVLILIGCLAANKAHAEQTLALSPSAVSIKGTAGQSATYSFRISNFTDFACSFTVELADVVVENGKRKFVPAGQSTNGMAELITTPVETLQVQPGQQTSIPVTFIIPSDTNIRAVAVFFNGKFIDNPEAERIRLRLGSVVDFTLSDNIQVEVSSPAIKPQTTTTNTIITENLDNVGTEPVIANGIAAIVNEAGTLVGKASFNHERLLPGEHNSLKAQYSGTLAPGKYRVFCSVEYGGRTQTNNSEFAIQ